MNRFACSNGTTWRVDPNNYSLDLICLFELSEWSLQFSSCGIGDWAVDLDNRNLLIATFCFCFVKLGLQKQCESETLQFSLAMLPMIKCSVPFQNYTMVQPIQRVQAWIGLPKEVF